MKRLTIAMLAATAFSVSGCGEAPRAEEGTSTRAAPTETPNEATATPPAASAAPQASAATTTSGSTARTPRPTSTSRANPAARPVATARPSATPQPVDSQKVAECTPEHRELGHC